MTHHVEVLEQAIAQMSSLAGVHGAIQQVIDRMFNHLSRSSVGFFCYDTWLCGTQLYRSNLVLNQVDVKNLGSGQLLLQKIVSTWNVELGFLYIVPTIHISSGMTDIPPANVCSFSVYYMHDFRTRVLFCMRSGSACVSMFCMRSPVFQFNLQFVITNSKVRAIIYQLNQFLPQVLPSDTTSISLYFVCPCCSWLHERHERDKQQAEMSLTPYIRTS